MFRKMILFGLVLGIVSTYGSADVNAVEINVATVAELEAAAATVNAGDTIILAAGTYAITAAIEIKDGVTYQGAGPDLTIIDGSGATRAFAGWGDRGATSGQIDDVNEVIPNLTGPKGWVLDGLTIQNCASDANDHQDILTTARYLLDLGDAPYTYEIALEESGALAESADRKDDPEWFDLLSAAVDNELTEAELQAYLDNNPVGSAGHLVVNDDKSTDGGAVCLLNGIEGIIRNCTFSNNVAVDDAGAIKVSGDVAIANCSFNLNHCVDQGGAIEMGEGSTGSTYTLTDCNFTGCYSGPEEDPADVTDDADGGALRVYGEKSSYVWTNCTFTGCYSKEDGGVVKYSAERSELTVTNCAVIGNGGRDPDGEVFTMKGLWMCNDDDAGPVTFINCLFADNVTADDRLIEVKADTTFLNCTFANNVGGDKPLLATRGRAWDSTGDGEDDKEAGPVFISNCLFINNTMQGDSDVIGQTRDEAFAAIVTNCLFFGNLNEDGGPANNTDEDALELGTIDVSAVTDANQLVVNPAAGGDYRPVAGSAAIDAANPATAMATDIEGTAAWGLRDVGVYEFVGGKYVVDNFESYYQVQDFNDPGAIFNVWLDGFVDANNGCIVGNPDAEQVTVHDGQQAMPFSYDNTGDAMYSEATRTFAQPRDWTGFDGVTLWFKGVPENTPGQLSMKINDVPYTGGGANLQSESWNSWSVPFAGLADVDLTHVQTVTLRVEGTGKGLLYIDDIELTAVANGN